MFINLIDNLDFDFDKSKIVSNIRIKYDFYAKKDKDSLSITGVSGFITNTAKSIIDSIKSVDRFIELCNMANKNKDIWGYDTCMNLFCEDDDYNYWIRLLAVENENNVWIKTYNKKGSE